MSKIRREKCATAKSGDAAFAVHPFVEREAVKRTEKLEQDGVALVL